MLGEADTDASAIKDAGWRQGSVLSAQHLEQLVCSGVLSIENIESVVAIIISHDCDVTNDSLDSEPAVEVLLGSRVQDENPNYRWSKSPRHYHLGVECDEDVLSLEFSIQELVRIPRCVLLDEHPDPKLVLSQDNVRELAAWVARRYVRSAFPDTFMSELDPSARR